MGSRRHGRNELACIAQGLQSAKVDIDRVHAAKNLDEDARTLRARVYGLDHSAQSAEWPVREFALVTDVGAHDHFANRLAAHLLSDFADHRFGYRREVLTELENPRNAIRIRNAAEMQGWIKVRKDVARE